MITCIFIIYISQMVNSLTVTHIAVAAHVRCTPCLFVM